MTKPGNVPGSKAIYYKEIDSYGNTIRVYKETYDSAGNLVHKHFMRVNGCDELVFINHYHEAEQRFLELGKIKNWTIDTSAINKLGSKNI